MTQNTPSREDILSLAREINTRQPPKGFSYYVPTQADREQVAAMTEARWAAERDNCSEILAEVQSLLRCRRNDWLDALRAVRGRAPCSQEQAEKALRAEQAAPAQAEKAPSDDDGSFGRPMGADAREHQRGMDIQESDWVIAKMREGLTLAEAREAYAAQMQIWIQKKAEQDARIATKPEPTPEPEAQEEIEEEQAEIEIRICCAGANNPAPSAIQAHAEELAVVEGPEAALDYLASTLEPEPLEEGEVQVIIDGAIYSRSYQGALAALDLHEAISEAIQEEGLVELAVLLQPVRLQGLEQALRREVGVDGVQLWSWGHEEVIIYDDSCIWTASLEAYTEAVGKARRAGLEGLDAWSLICERTPIVIPGPRLGC